VQDVVEYVEIFDQSQRLEDEAHPRDPKASPLRIAHGRDLAPSHDDPARCGHEDSRDQAEQRGLPATRGADDRDPLACADLETGQMKREVRGPEVAGVGAALARLVAGAGVPEAQVGDLDGHARARRRSRFPSSTTRESDGVPLACVVGRSRHVHRPSPGAQDNRVGP
jgi:hypothetical protein